MQQFLYLLGWLLWPVTVVYNAVTRLRNHLYNTGLKPSIQFEIPTVSVGNLTVGGTGKTPHIEYLIRLLKENSAIAVLSRGYGRQTKGIIIADEAANADIIGDEPMQFYRKFGDKVPVIVGEERVFAIPYLLEDFPDTQAILLDDAYQHRQLRASFQILLTDYNRPFYTDFLLPTGRLREARVGAKRADAIVVSKCPPRLSEQERRQIKQSIKAYSAPETPIFFSYIRYGNPVMMGMKPWSQKIVAVTGIAQYQPFIDYLNTQGNVVKHLEFKDHHRYTSNDIEKILEEAGDACIVMTEKDAVKWEEEEKRALWEQKSVYYLPIEVGFIEEEAQFQQLITMHISEFQA